MLAQFPWGIRAMDKEVARVGPRPAEAEVVALVVAQAQAGMLVQLEDQLTYEKTPLRRKEVAVSMRLWDVVGESLQVVQSSDQEMVVLQTNQLVLNLKNWPKQVFLNQKQRQRWNASERLVPTVAV